MLKTHEENFIIRIGIVGFWAFFWLFNVIDKFIEDPAFFWVGKSRLSQFTTYFESIGVTSEIVPAVFLGFTTILEIAAFAFFLIALILLLKRRVSKARHHVFFGILSSLVIFSFFAIGDQIFGDRIELLEHTIYWIALVISWFAYTHVE